MQDFVIGIDIGGTTTSLGLVNHWGEIVVETMFLTEAQHPVTFFLENLHQKIQFLTQNIAPIQIKAIGVGAPNANFYTGNLENPPNLHWGNIIPLRNIIQEKYKIPTAITNDANAATIGEMKFGIAQDMHNFILITLGTGLGSGIVVDKKLVYGYTGFAGEMGHIIVKENGRMCGDGRRGCLEAYVSATGLKRTVLELLADRLVPSLLREVNFENLSGEMITQAAKEQDSIALKAFEKTGEILGKALANAVVFTSPEAFIFFGGLAKAEDLLFEPTKKAFEKHCFKPFQHKTKFLISALQDKNAAVLGSAALAWEQLEN